MQVSTPDAAYDLVVTVAAGELRDVPDIAARLAGWPREQFEQSMPQTS